VSWRVGYVFKKNKRPVCREKLGEGRREEEEEEEKDDERLLQLSWLEVEEGVGEGVHVALEDVCEL